MPKRKIRIGEDDAIIIIDMQLDFVSQCPKLKDQKDILDISTLRMNEIDRS